MSAPHLLRFLPAEGLPSHHQHGTLVWVQLRAEQTLPVVTFLTAAELFLLPWPGKLRTMRERTILEAGIMDGPGSDDNEKGPSMTKYWLGVIVLAVGIISAFQSPINASLARRTGSVQATALSFTVGALVLLCAAGILTLTVHEPFSRGLGGAPWWMFTGGLIGAVFVATQTFLVPRLGAAGLIAGIIAGLLIGSIVIDRFGLFGLQRHAVSAPRLVGAALLVGGAGLVIWR